MIIGSSFYRISPSSHQRGAALVVSLIILMVITLLGVANMQTSTFQMKMASTNKERQTVFAIAEAGLRQAENELIKTPPSRAHMYNSCEGDYCFDESCVGGLCFSGDFPAASPGVVAKDSDCNLISNSSNPTAGTDDESTKFWSDSALDIWNHSNLYKTIAVPGSDTSVKYIVEFMCFANKPPPADLVSAGGDGLPFFRITVMAEGNDDRIKVMLQSTYALSKF